MATVELTELISNDIKCQCNKCNKVFTYTEVKRIEELIYNIKTIKPVCPYCNNSFTNIDDVALSYFDKFLHVNTDERLF